MNKKADERYLSPIMFFVWGLIAVSIFAGVLIFYSAKTDVRAEESEFLAKRVVNCLNDDGYLNENLISSGDNFDIFQECKLNEKVIDSSEFYLYIKVLNLVIEKGEPSLKTQCGAKENPDTEARYFAECFKTNVYALNNSNSSQRFLIDIITASNQKGDEG